MHGSSAQAGGEERVAEPPDFDSWVAARGPALLRLAYTLTGNPADAEDVVQEALARALARWSRISGVEDVNAYVRRMVVNAHTSWWRKFRGSPY
jgi:DNA-directed RNA polymerase specialized sigma24 family protein